MDAMLGRSRHTLFVPKLAWICCMTRPKPGTHQVSNHSIGANMLVDGGASEMFPSTISILNASSSISTTVKI